MAKRSSLPNIDALIGNIKPYGDEEAETGKPAMILLETIRLDPGQPRRLLPADLTEQIQLGTLSLVQAVQTWAGRAGVELSAESEPDEPAPHEASWLARRLQKVRELASSIVRMGLIHPVNVIPQLDGSNVLETGERRVLALAWLVACGLHEYERVPALFVSQSASHRSRQVIENVSREDLNAAEKARGLWNIRYEMSGLPNPEWGKLGKHTTFVAELERPNLAPWADVQRQFGISKRYRIWLTQTMELAPAAIKLIEQYDLPERATRPLVQFLRDDPEGQAQVLQSIASENPDGEEAGPNWSGDHVEMSVRQYLAEKGRGEMPGKPLPASEQSTGSVKVVLATKRAMRSLQRAIGPKSLGKKGLIQIANELAADDETVEIAKQIKPLVDALAASKRRVISKS